jgi:2-(1,2-epoxy-1,2-dihydrophenyl)acetyl-CoA isomerase
MTPEMGEALAAAIERAGNEAGAIALLGGEKAFSAGTNLKSSRMDNIRPDIDMGEKLEQLYNPLLLKIRDLPIPLISGISGAAAGVGCSIALMADIIVAGKSGFFLQAFCHVGLVPDGGAAYILSKSVGRVRAMELMLLGERYPAERAYQDGLITKVVEDDQVATATIEYANKLANGPAVALGLIRRAAWASLDSGFEGQLELDRKNQKTVGRTDDFREGVAAFRERRKAEFKGK